MEKSNYSRGILFVPQVGSLYEAPSSPLLRLSECPCWYLMAELCVFCLELVFAPGSKCRFLVRNL